jgi:hypothetical protein
VFAAREIAQCNFIAEFTGDLTPAIVKHCLFGNGS